MKIEVEHLYGQYFDIIRLEMPVAPRIGETLCLSIEDEGTWHFKVIEVQYCFINDNNEFHHIRLLVDGKVG